MGNSYKLFLTCTLGYYIKELIKLSRYTLLMYVKKALI